MIWLLREKIVKRGRKEKSILESVCITDSNGRLRESLLQDFLPLEKIIPGRKSRVHDNARICFVGTGKSENHGWILR